MNYQMESTYNTFENDFFIVVNSDKSEDFKLNTPASFASRIDRKIDLNGSWQVGLYSFFMNHSWKYDLDNCHIRIYHSACEDNFDISPLNLSLHMTMSRPYIDIPIGQLDLHKHNFVDDLNDIIMLYMKNICNEQETTPGEFDSITYREGLKFGFDKTIQHYFINFKYYAIFYHKY